MVDAEDDFQIGIQAGQIQCGGALADAAAYGLHQSGAGIGAGRQIAVFPGALAQRAVVGEFLSRLQNQAVNGLAGLAQVVVPVFVLGVGGLGVAQLVPEVGLVPQNFRADILHGNFHSLSGSGLVHQLLSFLHGKAIAVAAGHLFIGLQIQRGVHCRDAVFFGDGRNVRLFCGFFRGNL